MGHTQFSLQQSCDEPVLIETYIDYTAVAPDQRTTGIRFAANVLGENTRTRGKYVYRKELVAWVGAICIASASRCKTM